MNFLQDAFKEPGDNSIDSPEFPDARSPTDAITLDITYDDPDLHALFYVASSKWANKNLTDSLKQGRVTNDLWALGLPAPDAVTSVCITENQFLCVRAIVTCDELVDLSSLSDPANKSRQQLRIKRISIIESKNAADVREQQSPCDELCTISTPSNDDPVGISPITTLSDYYRRCHTGTFAPVHSTAPPPSTPTNTLQQPFQAHSEPIKAHSEPVKAHSEHIKAHSELIEAHSKPIAEPVIVGTTLCNNCTVLEKKQFSTELELGLQSRRLRDARNQLQKRQAEVERFASQLKDQELELALVKAQLSDVGESLARDVDHVPEQEDSDRNHHVAIIEAPDSALVVDASTPLSCVRCELRNQSARLSELQLRAMELKVTMSERRQIETESHAVRLLDALLLERQMRLQLQAELVAERRKRRSAEEVGEAIANEAKWPFVMPDMLDAFLKLEGIVGEVSHEGKEG